MPDPELVIEQRGPIATLTFNRPAQRNALTLGMLETFRRFFAELDPHGQTRVVVLRGAGERAFSSGSDFADLRLIQERGIVPSTPADPFEQALAALVACPLPVIAAIQGYAVGGGLALAAACDLRIAGQGAQLGMPPARLGLLYSQHELQPFLDLLGPGRVKLLFYTGRLLSAADALQLGLVDLVVPDGRLEAEVAALAEEIAGNAPLTIRHTKRILTHLTHRPLGEPEQAEIAALIQQAQRSQDFQEGQQAIVERRPPRFRGC
jgi:enoyl-CoA hydratase/carnithine racemase